MGMTSKEYHEGYQQGFKDAKADYETRLKADLVAMLEELNLEIDEMFARRIDYTVDRIQDLIQEKINSLKEGKDGKID